MMNWLVQSVTRDFNTPQPPSSPSLPRTRFQAWQRAATPAAADDATLADDRMARDRVVHQRYSRRATSSFFAERMLFAATPRLRLLSTFFFLLDEGTAFEPALRIAAVN